MIRRFMSIIGVCLCVAAFMVLSINCTSSEQATPYPADVSGRVTIAEEQISSGETYSPYWKEINESFVFWMVEVKAKNKAYSDKMETYNVWEIVHGDECCQSAIWDTF